MNEWISVKDRLPEVNEKFDEEFNVTCEHPNMKIVTTLSFCNGGWEDDYCRDWNEYVTHWMPLPKPPEEN